LRLSLSLAFPLRVLASLALIGTPVFFAGISFSRLFKQEKDVGYPFGINMVGAMTGGAASGGDANVSAAPSHR